MEDGDAENTIDQVFATEPLGRGISPRAQLIMGLTWMFTAFAIVAVGFRFWLRRKFNQRYALDDWVMLGALFFHLLFQIFLSLAASSGMGYPLETITIDEYISLTMWGWCTTAPNILANAIARISIAMVLVQIFGIHRWFKVLMISFTGLLAFMSFSNFLFLFFQASPFPAIWDFRILAQWRLPQRPHISMIFTQIIFYTTSDFLYAFLPVILIWNLNLATRRKVGLALIMAGSFITMGASISRAVIIGDSLRGNTVIDLESVMSADYVYIFFGVSTLLASIEVSLVIILGSLPKLKIATKLNSFKTFSSSVGSAVSRFWTTATETSRGGGTTRGSTTTYDNKVHHGGRHGDTPGLSDSDVELNRGGASSSLGDQSFGTNMDRRYDFNVTTGSPSLSVGSSMSPRLANKIKVTEGYAVTYEQEEPKNMV